MPTCKAADACCAALLKPAFAASLLAIALPLFFWLCYWQGWPFWLGGFLLLPLAWRRNAVSGLLGWVGPGVALLGVVALVLRSTASLLYYPVLVSAIFLLAFAVSLFQSQTLVERVARRFEPELPPAGVRYTRQVTLAWCAFFVVNGGIAWWTTTQPTAVWLLYNGLISYLATGAMFAGEWLIRRQVKRRFPAKVSHE